MTEVYDIEFPGVMKVTRDMLKAFQDTEGDTRAAVDLYYQLQDFRKAAANQGRALEASGEPHSFNDWGLQQFKYMENTTKRFLDGVSLTTEAGRWARTQKGIGPVIAAGLDAHIDITKAPTVGHIWRFAGLDPTVKWEKKTKRPWNAQLKTLCWKIGESFVKVSGDETALYGKVYKERKEKEVAKNEAGDFADQAARI